MKNSNLAQHILLLSEEKKDFLKASQEWNVFSVEDTKSKTCDCPCGKTGIRYLCYIQNSKTTQITFVGNECIKRFSNDEANHTNVGEIVQIASKCLSLNGIYCGLDKYKRLMFEVHGNSKIVKSKKMLESYFGSIPVFDSGRRWKVNIVDKRLKKDPLIQEKSIH